MIPACRHIIRAATTLDTPEMAAAIDQCRSTGHAVIECSVAQPDGTIVWIRNEMRLAEPFDAAIVGYLTDVTAEHALRQRLKLAERLEAATAAVIAEGAVRTYDMGGSATTLEMAEAIARRF